MRVLRLATSDDVIRDVPEQLRSPRIAESVLAAAVGEPVETIARPIWPRPNLPDLVDRWLEQYRPNLVYFTVVPFWYVYESVPVRLERRLGPVGRKLGPVGQRVAGTPFSNTLLFRALRLAGMRTMGGEPHFSPEQVLEVVSACIRRIVVHEDVALVVIGSTGRRCVSYGWGGVARDSGRRATVHEGLSALCSQLHVPYFGGDRLMQTSRWKALLGTDGSHLGVEGQRAMGLEQGAQMVAAWDAAGRARAAPPTLALE
jgi:hypothetical protein